ncbi:hypothetical protein D3C86_1883660 [compost metagenome]
MAEVKKLVLDYTEFVHKIAEELLKREDLTGDEIEEIFTELYGDSRPRAIEVKPIPLKKLSLEKPLVVIDDTEEDIQS